MAKILVIDDTEEVRDLLRKALVRDGHEVITTCDGEQGIRTLRSGRFDLIITDIFMPEKEGLELLSEIGGRSSEIPVIAISGQGDLRGVNVLDLALKLGATKTMAKPFTVAELREAVTSVLVTA